MNFPYKKIAITGGAGFIGSNIAIKLKENYSGIQVIALDNLKRRGSELNLPRLKKSGVNFIHADIRDKKDLQRVSCDLVIECSAEPSCTAGIDTGLDYVIDTNLLGTVNCLDFASVNKADFLFLSTSRIYPFGKINSLDFDEEETRFSLALGQEVPGVSEKGINEEFTLDGAKTFYGATKLASEMIIKEYIYFKGLRALVNRCGVIAGPWQMGKVDQGIVGFWLASHIFGRPLKYLGWEGSGKQVRDFLHIDDLFKLLELQLKNFNKCDNCVFNVGGGADFSFSLKELTEVCQKVTNRKVPTTEDPSVRPGDVKWYITDTSKVSLEFDWKPKIKLEDTVAQIAQWIKSDKEFLKGIL